MSIVELPLDVALQRVKIILNANDQAAILDVGGGMQPLLSATHVMDILPYNRRSWYGDIAIPGDVLGQRYSEATWSQKDVCNTPWDYPDKSFDFVWCTQLIEDVRDLLAVIREISRVGKCGYVTTIHRSFESKLDVNDPLYAGYIHHRWLIELENNKVKFLFKYPLIHAYDEYRPKIIKQQFLEFWWEGSLEAYEQQLYTLQEIQDVFKGYAEAHS